MNEKITEILRKGNHAPNVQEAVAFEKGDIEARDLVNMFSRILGGWKPESLQGDYRRTAQELIGNKILTESGEITQYGLDLLDDIEAGIIGDALEEDE